MTDTDDHWTEVLFQIWKFVSVDLKMAVDDYRPTH
jgi:hypothetical protein